MYVNQIEGFIYTCFTVYYFYKTFNILRIKNLNLTMLTTINLWLLIISVHVYVVLQH